MISPPSNRMLMFFLSVSLFCYACGSRSTDLSTDPDIENPLPPCHDTPNCVRTTRAYDESIDSVWEATLSVFKKMKPYDMEITADEYRVDTVFLVVFFRDDLVLKLEEASEKTFLHIRSESRLGYYDFGMNAKRVNRFLDMMEEGL